MKTFTVIPFRPTRRGFTLVEMLVVILIVVILAVLSVTFLNRGKLASAKSVTISQLRNIHVGIVTYMADKNISEPPGVSTGAGDFPAESNIPGTSAGPYPFGNPARALFNVTEPTAGYVQDPSYFFSPLIKNHVPTVNDYKPNAATATNIWGTYAWFHPWKVRSGIPRVDPAKENLLLMSVWYDSTEGKKFSKQHFLVLMRDGNIENAGESESGNTAFNQWSGFTPH